jgi:hypothetical protein
MNLRRLAWLVGVALLVMIANVAISVLYMVIYSYLIDPGHDQRYYEGHIQMAAPYCSIVAGIPLMFLAGWWVSRSWNGEFPIRSALVVWLVYVVIDLSVLLAAGLNWRIALLFAVSFITKLAAVLLPVTIRGRKLQTTA